MFLCDSVSKPFPLSLLKHGAACSNDLYRSKNRIFCVHSSGSARGRKLPPYGWTSKNYVICVCFHCHGTSSYHTTNTKPYKFPMHCSKRVSFWGTSYSRPPIDPYLTSPVTKSWRRHWFTVYMRICRSFALDLQSVGWQSIAMTVSI